MMERGASFRSSVLMSSARRELLILWTTLPFAPESCPLVSVSRVTTGPETLLAWMWEVVPSGAPRSSPARKSSVSTPQRVMWVSSKPWPARPQSGSAPRAPMALSPYPACRMGILGHGELKLDRAPNARAEPTKTSMARHSANPASPTLNHPPVLFLPTTASVSQDTTSRIISASVLFLFPFGHSFPG